ncbi:MAG: hypothetical protein HC779_05840, partial [Phyllobacteriaceae bacterium]|nr:hypothetical protein [Phyllobacteriaceae bacterium]
MPALDVSSAGLNALTQQINRLSDEMRTNGGTHAGPDIALLDDRLAGIEQRLGVMANAAARPDPSADMLLETLEARLADISGRLSGVSAPDDSGLVRLESQIADLSKVLAGTVAQSDFASRFDAIEDQLANQQTAVMDAARRAAEDVAARLIAQHPGTSQAQSAQGLAEDLAHLEALTRDTQDRSARSFEAVHDTLVKLVERISSIESRPAQPVSPVMPSTVAAAPLIRAEMPATAQLAVPEADEFALADMAEPFAPALDGYADEMEQPEPPKARKPRSPLEMAQAAAAAAMRNLDPRAPEAELAELPKAAPVAFTDEPLAPGSGVPDLNAILKRVRDQKKAAQADIATDASRKDFFSSVKRAAQAAAAEVEAVGPKTAKSSPLSTVKDVYARFRRPILLVAAAAIVAIGGLQLSSAFLGEPALEPDLPIATGMDSPASAPAPVAIEPAPEATAQAAIPTAEPSALPATPQAAPAAI